MKESRGSEGSNGEATGASFKGSPAREPVCPLTRLPVNKGSPSRCR